MKKYIIIFLTSILSSVQVWAECKDVPDWNNYDWGSNQKNAIKYEHAKTVYDSTDGNIKTRDSLIVWNKNASELCFSIMTYSNYFNNCSVDGKANNLKNGNYSYTYNQCRISLKLLKDKAKMNVIGPSGNYCVDEDFGTNSHGGNNCGTNASVDSATYIRIRGKKP